MNSMRISASYLIVIILIILSLLRNEIWQSGFSLWSDTLRKSPKKPRVIDSVGKSLDEMGFTERAIEYYKKALSLNPKQVKARHHLFNAYIRLNMPEKALEVITAPEAEFVEHPAAYRILVNLFARLGRYEDAIKSFEKLIELEPENQDNYTDFGIFLININQPEKAIKVFKHALSRWPENPELLNNLGVAYEESGRFKEAEEAYRSALSILPEAKEPQENLRRLLSKRR
jgi:tetratricopeptide (TPR) repeat protein